MSMNQENASKAIARAYTAYRIEKGTYYDEYTDSVYENVWLVAINNYILPEIWFDVEDQALKFIEELALQDAECTDRRVTVDLLNKGFFKTEAVLVVAPRNAWSKDWVSEQENLLKLLSRLANYTYEKYWKDVR